MTRTVAGGIGGVCLAAAMMATPAAAEGLWGLQLDGSFGQNGFSRYVPPLTNPIFNESPFITTEVKPIYVYHKMNGDFPLDLADGGSVNVAALQARLAITDRLGFIATTDGYTWINFDNNPALEDADGWNDITIGLKYALVNNPQEGEILSAGLRYTIPLGNIDIDGAGPLAGGSLDVNGIGGGYINPFISGAKLWDKTQLQGMVGAQIALDSSATSSILAAAHVDYEIMPGLYPLLETNLFVPIEGGDQLTDGVLGGALNELTGAEIIDLGSDDPKTVWTIGGGVRYALSDNAMLGLGGDYNVLQDENHAYGWRLLADVVIHF